MLNRLIVLAALLLPACLPMPTNTSSAHWRSPIPWSRELPPNAPTVAAYFVIHNEGKTADRLLSVEPADLG